MKPNINIIVLMLLFVVTLLTVTVLRDEAFNPTPTEITYVYNEDKIDLVVSGKKESKMVIEKIDKEISEDMKEDTNEAQPSVEYVSSTSFMDYKENDPMHIENTINSNEMQIPSYEIDFGQKKIYVSDINLYEEALQSIFHTLIPVDSAYETFKREGVVPSFVYDNVNYISMKLDDNYKVSKKKINEELVMTDVSDVQEKLLHNDEEKFEKITGDKGVTQIVKDNYDTQVEFELSNPGIDEETLVYEGQPMNVTKIDPLIDIETVYEYSVEENIKFSKRTVEDDELPFGEKEVTQEGKDGVADVTYRVRKNNLKEESKEQVDYKLKSKVKDEITTVGTKRSFGPAGDAVVVGNFDQGDGIATGQFAWPSQSKTVTCNTNCHYTYQNTPAIDIQSYYGGPVYAADGGVVTSSGPDPFGGLRIDISHSNGYETVYVHQSKNYVNVGDKVTKGQIIGIEGQTGNATGHHVHFEIKKNGAYYDPMLFY